MTGVIGAAEGQPEACGNPFCGPGRWYRGNVHAHTTLSDGLLSSAETAAWYQAHGYDFLALTDHNQLAPVDGLSSEGFLVLPGIETHPGESALAQPYHIIAVGLTTEVHYDREDDVQGAIDALRADGAVVWLGHPYWLGLTLPEFVDLHGLIGLEVYNATCTRFGKGLSSVHWDDLLACGHTAWGLAVDDCHIARDFGCGWVVVKAPELTPQAILQALSAGRFYASQGPEIYDVQVSAEGVYVRCSPVQTVTCVSLAGTGEQAIAPGPDLLITEATLPLRFQHRYVRVECTDASGRTAWSPPIPL